VLLLQMLQRGVKQEKDAGYFKTKTAQM